VFKSISFFAVIVLFSVAVSVNAQDTTSLSGKYALQFQVSQNFTLGSFLGSVISGKYHLTDETAIRVGLGLKMRMNNQASKSQFNQSSTVGDIVYESNNQVLNLVVQYLLTPVLADNTRFYFGVGPKMEIGFSKVSTGDSNIDNDGNYYYYRAGMTGSEYSIGVMCSAGVEWFFAKQMSLCAEYGLVYAYSYAKSNSDNYISEHSTNEQRVYSYSLSGDNVRFGLSVYF
jgi:uncharacterized membrane protein YciS (DUF1049 family)